MEYEERNNGIVIEDYTGQQYLIKKADVEKKEFCDYLISASFFDKYSLLFSDNNGCKIEICKLCFNGHSGVFGGYLEHTKMTEPLCVLSEYGGNLNNSHYYVIPADDKNYFSFRDAFMRFVESGKCSNDGVLFTDIVASSYDDPAPHALFDAEKGVFIYEYNSCFTLKEIIEKY